MQPQRSAFSYRPTLSLRRPQKPLGYLHYSNRTVTCQAFELNFPKNQEAYPVLKQRTHPGCQKRRHSGASQSLCHWTFFRCKPRIPAGVPFRRRSACVSLSFDADRLRRQAYRCRQPPTQGDLTAIRQPAFRTAAKNRTLLSSRLNLQSSTGAKKIIRTAKKIKSKGKRSGDIPRFLPLLF